MFHVKELLEFTLVQVVLTNKKSVKVPPTLQSSVKRLYTRSIPFSLHPTFYSPKTHPFHSNTTSKVTTMALPTPPSSAAKSGKFMEPANKLTTYEDFYSQRNEDEDFDRFPDSCEDETDSDDFDYAERVGVRRADFFARFTYPKGQKAVGQSGLDRFGEVKPGAGMTQPHFISDDLRDVAEPGFEHSL